MTWLLLLVIALTLVPIGWWLGGLDEIYPLVIYSIGIISILWGLAIAPTPAQITVEVCALGWFRLKGQSFS